MTKVEQKINDTLLEIQQLEKQYQYHNEERNKTIKAKGYVPLENEKCGYIAKKLKDKSAYLLELVKKRNLIDEPTNQD